MKKALVLTCIVATATAPAADAAYRNDGNRSPSVRALPHTLVTARGPHGGTVTFWADRGREAPGLTR
ncbi:MAG: hypothetical protein QOE36_3673 [Gaiellaceae bacterium]|jgi:hypothetical protein|nr:hypothetical protein [Gaiellaceae bacterium]